MILGVLAERVHAPMSQIGYRLRVLIGCLLLLSYSTACSFPGPRPQNLRGAVQCQVIARSPVRPLLVKVVLDEAAVQQHSQFEVIREVLIPSNATEEVSLLAVDVGSAMGAID
jgi:hypothetical protein